MAAMFANDSFECIFFNKKNHGILIEISLNFLIKDPIDSKSALVQVIGWHRTGDKWFSEPMLTKMPGAIWHHLATMS